jgi:hypothetical protein
MSIPIRQPLQSMTFCNFIKLPNEYLEIIKKELNIKEIFFQKISNLSELEFCKKYKLIK